MSDATFSRDALAEYERGSPETVTPAADPSPAAAAQVETEATNAVSAVPAAAEAEPAAVLQQPPPALQDLPRPDRPFAERLAEYKRGNPDFDAALASYKLPPLPELVSRVVVRSEAGPALLHHLALNPDAAERLSQLSGVEALTELQRIERTLAPSRPDAHEFVPAARRSPPARYAASASRVSNGMASMLDQHRGQILKKETNQRDRATADERRRYEKKLRG